MRSSAPPPTRTDLVRKARAHKPDVVIADIQMPPGNTDDGLRAAQADTRRQPEIGVLILSQYLEARYALDLVGDRAEGVGYLLKDRLGDLSVFTDAVRRVARGGSALDPEVVQRMVGRPRAAGPLAELTQREREVLALIAEGRSNAAIAERLVVTVGAIERHVTSIFDKLGLRSTRRTTGACWPCSNTSSIELPRDNPIAAAADGRDPVSQIMAHEPSSENPCRHRC